MSYENAPATKMVATNCLVCSRPLVDAKSVEVGVGPECRKRHGFDKPDVEVAVEHACEVCAELPHEVASAVIFNAHSTRELANRIVYRAAALRSQVIDPGHHALFLAYVTLLGRIGFGKLSAAVARSLTRISLTLDGALKAPYSPDLLSNTGKIPGRRWDAPTKTTYFPKSCFALVARALLRTYGPEQLVATDAGLTTAGRLAEEYPVAEESGGPLDDAEKPSVRLAALRNTIVLHAPYSAPGVEQIRQIAGRRWDAFTKAWTFPNTPSAMEAVRAVLAKHYAGRHVDFVDHGTYRIDAEARFAA